MSCRTVGIPVKGSARDEDLFLYLRTRSIDSPVGKNSTCMPGLTSAWTISRTDRTPQDQCNRRGSMIERTLTKVT